MAKSTKEKKGKESRKTSNKSPLATFAIFGGGAIAFMLFMGFAGQYLNGRRSVTSVPDAAVQFQLPTLPARLRPSKCPASPQNNSKEIVSIIIPYYKEEIFRIHITMSSILQNTNMKLVKEIMWVSDGNGPEQIFRKELEAKHPKVSVHVNDDNKGLIVTKMEAAARASGSVLVFLEPHVVAAPGWLEPLLNRIAEEPHALVMPTLDVLNADMTSYQPMPFGYWRFEWNLNLVFANPWQADKRKDFSGPFASPGTSGGIYAIRKDWWDHLEFFDPEMIRWGGDHIEASHKVWRCGGRIEIHPCSRIGHWYRVEADRPYDVPVPNVVRNYKRLAEVWLDGHKDSFYKMKPEAREMEFGDIKEMHKVRERLKCKDMDWYLENVDVEAAWEEHHICIPGAPKHQGGCEKAQAANGRSTIDRFMPVKEFKERWASLPTVNPPKKQEL